MGWVSLRYAYPYYLISVSIAHVITPFLDIGAATARDPRY